MQEDFTEFTDTDDFAVTATYTPLGALVSRAVDGIYRAPYETAAGMESSAPTFSCAAADVTGINRGDALRIDGVRYLVANLQPDATGWLVVVLELP